MKNAKRGPTCACGFFVHLSLLHAQGTWRTAGARYNNGSLANRKRQIAYAPNHTLAHFSALFPSLQLRLTQFTLCHEYLGFSLCLEYKPHTIWHRHHNQHHTGDMTRLGNRFWQNVGTDYWRELVGVNRCDLNLCCAHQTSPCIRLLPPPSKKLTLHC